jgi:hypothetical protein
MKRSSGPRKTANFSRSIHQQLNMYALAAGAAGVGVLALAQPAEAKIVYTAAHIPIVVNGPDALVDLNHDGVSDFKFRNAYQPQNCRPSCTQSHSESLTVTPLRQTNGVWGVVSQKHLCAAALAKGRRVGPFSPFTSEEGLKMAFFSVNSITNNFYCPWLKVKGAYLAVKFVIKEKEHSGWKQMTHFGWVRIRMRGLGHNETITGYAYETIPNKAIFTGETTGLNEINDSSLRPNPESLPSSPSEPATLGLLAMGAPGLSIWRRKESLAATQ